MLRQNVFVSHPTAVLGGFRETRAYVLRTLDPVRHSRAALSYHTFVLRSLKLLGATVRAEGDSVHHITQNLFATIAQFLV